MDQAAEEIAVLKDRFRRLRYRIPTLDGYADHRENCEVFTGQPCDCGLEKLLREVYDLLKE